MNFFVQNIIPDITMIFTNRLKFASKLASIHFSISLLVAILLAALVFGIWYPYPYSSVMGSFKLFVLVISVDVVCGPLLTFILASPAKKRSAMILDMTLIIIIQLSAFCYGFYSVYEARPVALVYEKDRLRVLANVDIYFPELTEAPKDYQKVPLFGIWQLGTREISEKDDTIALVEFALQGYDIAQRPSWWIPYESARTQMQRHAKPLAQLRSKANDMEKIQLENIVEKNKMDMERLWYLPLTSPTSSDWTAILDQDMNFLDVIPFDSFSD